jgi:hypothetical protein
VKSTKIPAIIALALFMTPALCSQVYADMEDAEKHALTQQAEVSVGYRGISSDDDPSRAREYDKLQASPTFGLRIYNDFEAFHIDIESKYLNEDDYFLDAYLDMESKVRLDLRTERFYHNLDHIPYNNGYTGTPPARNLTDTPVDGSRPDGMFPADTSFRNYYSDQDPGKDYGMRLDMSETSARFKIPKLPAHINVAYWRYEKNGDQQLRFVDENCTGCHMQSKSRKIDRITEEFRADADAHLGYVDLAVQGLYREFRDREPIPSDAFGSHFRGRDDGVYYHDEDPDSRLTELTISLNTSQAGGLVGAASFTIGERKNLSDLNSVVPVEAKTDFYKTTADVTYTPGDRWTVNMRYRLLDLDSNNSSQIYDYNVSNPNPLPVRSAMDITRNWYEASVNYRPYRFLTFKAELHREDIDRSNTGLLQPHISSATDPIVINSNWQLPDKETKTQAKFGFNSRLFDRRLKVHGWSAIRRSDDPAYGTSVENGSEAFLAASYAFSPRWGLSASVDLVDEDNSQDVRQLDAAFATVYRTYDLDRNRKQQTVSFGAWSSPLDGLALDLNYGFLRTHIKQDLLFGAEPNSENPLRDYTIDAEDVDYKQTVQTVSAGATWQIFEPLTCRVEGYYIHSKAHYDPDFFGVYEYLSGTTVIPGIASSSDLREISDIDIHQNGLRGRLTWQFTDAWNAAFVATYDDYNDDYDVFDGSVQTYMASLARTW